VKMHPIKSIPAPGEAQKGPDLADAVLAYALAIGALLLAGIVTISYGFVLGLIASVTPAGPAISQGFMSLGLPVLASKLPQTGAALGFVAFCFTLPRIARR